MQRRTRLGLMLAPAVLGLMGCATPEATNDGTSPLANPSTTGSGAGSSTILTTASAPDGEPPSPAASTALPPAGTDPTGEASGPSATTTSDAVVSGVGGVGPPPGMASSSASNTSTVASGGAGGGGDVAPGEGGAAASASGGAPMMNATGGTTGGSSGSATAMGGTAGTSGAAGAGGSATARPQRVLLYSFSTLDIPSVPAQLSILGQTLVGWEFEVEESVDPAVFTDENLENYAAVGMINTCFSPFGQNQSGDGPEARALRSFVQAGGGLFGTHCADVTFQSANPPPLYNELLGGRASSQYFEGSSSCRKLDEHPTVTELPETFEYVGNLDATDFLADDTIVLVRCTWSDANATDIPVSWVRSEGAGRVFFTSFGKVDADLTDVTIGNDHIVAGLAWVLGR